jgi:hypothetical protein
MTKGMTTIDRRRNRRVPVEDSGDAMLFGPEFTKGIQIVDISKGGVGFRYVAGHQNLSEPQELELDVLWNHIGVFLLELKVKIVSDSEIPNEYLLDIVPIRRCSGEFVDLTEDQISQLNFLVESNGVNDLQTDSFHAVQPAL